MDTDLFRAHGRDLGPWWFGNDGAGRFDLVPPRGTCYLALDPLSALRERLGPVLGGSQAVPESLLEESVVSRLRLSAARDVADTQDRGAAEFGVTRELNHRPVCRAAGLGARLRRCGVRGSALRPAVHAR